jgi:hypothetical protein
MEKKFPYYARFTSIVKASVDSALDKYLSKASLEDLKSLDISTEVDLEKNIDLIGTVFNAAVINRLNKNDDGIATDTALAIKDLFIHKPHNLEHKSNRIVGHIVKAGWSTFGGNQMLTDEQVKGMKEPFNLVLGGVVYRLVDEKFADLLVESSDESSDKYQLIATSWEIGFTDYHIVLGSKNIAEAEIVSDPERIKELKQYLRCNGGPGKTPDGKYIGRLIVGGVGEVLPVGMAFTTKPAAEVSGVVTQDWTDLLSPEEKADLVTQTDASTEKIQENSSQTVELDVKNNSQAETPMKFKTIKDLMAAIASKDSVTEASVSEFIAEQLEVKAKEWEAEQNKKANALKDTADRATALEGELAKANAKIAEVTATLESLQKDMQAKQREADFQTRMSAIASEYELSDKESELVAKQIKNLDETAYASWFENFSVFAASKNKKAIAAAKEEADKKVEEAKKLALAEIAKASEAQKTEEQKKLEIAQASEQEKKAAEVATAALEKTTETANQGVANAATPTTATDPRKEWTDAFGGENIKITL